LASWAIRDEARRPVRRSKESFFIGFIFVRKPKLKKNGAHILIILILLH